MLRSFLCQELFVSRFAWNFLNFEWLAVFIILSGFKDFQRIKKCGGNQFIFLKNFKNIFQQKIKDFKKKKISGI